MNQSTSPRLRFQIFLFRRAAAEPSLGLDSFLPDGTVRQVLDEQGATRRHIFYTPWLTFWAFFRQALGPDHSCRAAVKRITAAPARRGTTVDHEDTSPYCKARARLPESVFSRPARRLGRRSHDAIPAEWLWCGHRVKLVDGTTVSMPDTPANQAEYPQSPSQTPGLGFPIARMVVVSCPAAGSVLDAAEPKKGT